MKRHLSPRAGRRMHLAAMAVWGAQMVAVPFVLSIDWRVYLLEISLYANFVGHWSGYSAERPTEIA